MTLPLIRAIEVGTPDEAAIIRNAITGGRPHRVPPGAGGARPARGALDHARACAQRESDAAVACVSTLPAYAAPRKAC
ncbi:MAG: hypothetical protein V9E94_14830 [Microthrixaceae bacterium]